MNREVEAVRMANRAFYRAFESLELAEMDEVWAQAGQVTCAHPGWTLADGWPSVRESWATIFRNTAEIRFQVSDEKIDVRGDLAWVVCVERITSGGGGGAVLATNVFRNEAGRWRMVHHHGSPFVPAAPSRSTPKPRADATKKVLN
jgi:ketosteroid isomerase-like protein